jgi:hypothetical protein
MRNKPRKFWNRVSKPLNFTPNDTLVINGVLYKLDSYSQSSEFLDVHFTTLWAWERKNKIVNG